MAAVRIHALAAVRIAVETLVAVIVLPHVRALAQILVLEHVREAA